MPIPRSRGLPTNGARAPWLAASACVGVFWCLSPRPAGSQDSSDVAARAAARPDTFAVVRGVDEIVLAQELATLGRAKQYPLSLAAAAQLLQNNPISKLIGTRSKPAPVTAPAAGGKRQSSRAPLDAPQLLNDARRMARNDASTLAVVRQVERQRSRRTRGAAGGPRVLEDTLQAGASHEHEIMFERDEPAAVSVVGDGDTALECTAHDANGAVLAADTSGGRGCTLRWWAAATAPVRVVIRNPGQVWNSYLLVTN